MESDAHPAFADLLRSYRIAAGLTQEELAERAGLSAKAISMLECGVTRMPHRDTVALLAHALGLDTSERAALDGSVRRRRGPAAQAPAAPSLPPLPPGLAVPPTPLIGRDAEVAAVTHLLRVEGVRLLTLTGPPGVGKTRLAVEVAASLGEQYPDGVVVVALASLRDPALMLPTIAQTLGVNEAAGRSLRETLILTLRERPVLLILDNVEQLTEGAPAILDLIAACPRLQVLLTSRVALRVRGERQISLAPLTLPDPAAMPPLEALSQLSAVKLFVQCARAVQPDFALTAANASIVAAICRRLDGLPLAIELAAARIRLLPPRALLSRLERRLQVLTDGPRDLPVRQQTLRDAVTWSYDLLDSSQQALFRALSIFAGGCAVEAVAAVCAARAAPAETDTLLRGLASLVDKSLLWSHEEEGGEPRLGMLETLREYGQERLVADGELEALQRRHATYYLALAEEAEPALTGPEQEAWLGRLEAEHENLRAALEWARASGRYELALRMAGALWRFWFTRGHLSEGRGWLEPLLERADVAEGESAAPAYRAALAKALHGTGALLMVQGDSARAELLYERSLALNREVGHRAGIAQTLNNLGLLARERGDDERAVELYGESAALYRELGDAWGIATALNNLGGIAYFQGAGERATALFEESLALQRAAGNTWGIAAAVSNLGNVAQQQGNYDRAARLYEESLALYRHLEDRRGIAQSLNNLGSVADEQGDYDRAARLYEESLTLFRQLKDRRGIAGTLDNLGLAVRQQGDYARAASLHEESLALERAMGDTWGIATALCNLGLAVHALGQDGRAEELLTESMTLFRSLQHSQGMAQVLEAFARLCVAQRRVERAAHLIGTASACRATIGAPLPPVERAALDSLADQARAMLGEAAWTAAWELGRSATLEHVVTDLLGDRPSSADRTRLMQTSPS